MTEIGYLKDLLGRLDYSGLKKQEFFPPKIAAAILFYTTRKNWVYIVAGKKNEYWFDSKIQDRIITGEFHLKEYQKIQDYLNELKQNKEHPVLEVINRLWN